jgi:ribonuclease HI
MSDYVAWFDGACEPVNPGGTATSGAIIKAKEGTVLLEEGRLVGKGSGMSSNVAEYAAIIRVFEYLMSRSPGHVTVHGDSNLVISQLNGKWAARKGLYYSTYLEARELLCCLRSLGRHVDLLRMGRRPQGDRGGRKEKFLRNGSERHRLWGLGFSEAVKRGPSVIGEAPRTASPKLNGSESI